MAKQKGICDKFCKGCAFLCRVNGNAQATCDYFFRTGKRRPCPAGTGCTVKLLGTRKSLWSYHSDHTEQRLIKERDSK